jgi:uncharacterized protein (DUF1330 family)
LTAYVISENTILEEATVAAYQPLAAQAVLEHGGEVLARYALPEQLEGPPDPSQRFVIIRFPAADTARAWYSSDTYAKALRVVAGGGLRRRLFIVEGV